MAAAMAPDIKRSVLNIGSGTETSLLQLVDALSRVIDRQPDVLHNVQQSGGLTRLVADLSEARRVLGYQPRVSLTEGLQRLVAEDSYLVGREKEARGTGESVTGSREVEERKEPGTMPGSAIRTDVIRPAVRPDVKPESRLN